jgi:enamine deaminase RidA (YjgF/YER057c/UK114 family)
MKSIEARLEELGIVLPDAPDPIANYVSVQRTGNLLFLSGAGPMVEGKPVYVGKVGAEVSPEEAYDAARIAGTLLIASLKRYLGSLDRVKQVVKLLGFVASATDFYEQPKCVNGCSDLLVAVFGDRGKHARSAVATPVLPMNLPIEIEIIVEITEE